MSELCAFKDFYSLKVERINAEIDLMRMQSRLKSSNIIWTWRLILTEACYLQMRRVIQNTTSLMKFKPSRWRKNYLRIYFWRKKSHFMLDKILITSIWRMKSMIWRINLHRQNCKLNEPNLKRNWFIRSYSIYRICLFRLMRLKESFSNILRNKSMLVN